MARASHNTDLKHVLFLLIVLCSCFLYITQDQSMYNLTIALMTMSDSFLNNVLVSRLLVWKPVMWSLWVVLFLSLLNYSCNWFPCWSDTTNGTIGGNKICSCFRSFRNRYCH